MKREINDKKKNINNQNSMKWNKKESISKGLDTFIHLVGYTLVLITVSVIFKKIVFISNIWFGFLAVLIIFILNKTVKPVLTWLTIPLTAMTLGLFYPLINAFILKLSDWILGSQFDVNGIIWLIVVSIVITIMNAIMDNFIIDGIIKGGKKK